MPRIKVTRLRKFCGQLAGHSWQQAERVAKAAADLVRQWLPPDQEEVSLREFHLYLGERLEHERKRLTDVDNQHLHELQIDRNLRQERDARAARVRERMLQLRDSLDGLFGPGGGAKIFEDAPSIPKDPMALAQFTGHVLDNLGNEAFPMPTPLQEGFSLDREQVVRQIEIPHQRLVEVLKELENTESNSKFSQARKDGQIDDTEGFAFKAARYQEAFFDLVGLEGLSDRVRRSSHRAASGGEPPPDPEDEAPELGPEPSATAAIAASN